MKMAPSPSFSLSYMLLILLIQIHHSSSNDLVDEICMHNDDPAFCTKSFNSDARTPGADMADLGEISIDIGLVWATNISNLVIWMNNTATEPRIKKCFNICFEWYDIAKDALVNASDALIRQAYDSMNIYAHLAGFDGQECENSFNDPVSPVPSPLTVQNKNFYDLTHATLVISNMLLRP